MTRHPVGTTVSITGCAWRGRTGVVVETAPYDQHTWPDYQRVALDDAEVQPQLILITDCTPYAKKGQMGLFGEAA